MGHTPYPGLSLRGWGPGRLWLARLGYEFSLFSPGVRLLIDHREDWYLTRQPPSTADTARKPSHAQQLRHHNKTGLPWREAVSGREEDAQEGVP